MPPSTCASTRRPRYGKTNWTLLVESIEAPWGVRYERAIKEVFNPEAEDPYVASAALVEKVRELGFSHLSSPSRCLRSKKKMLCSSAGWAWTMNDRIDAGLWHSAQFLGNSRANHSRHCSAVQAAFSSMTGLALGRLRRFSTVNRRGSGIVWAVSQ